jgi:hypothetical protein
MGIPDGAHTHGHGGGGGLGLVVAVIFAGALAVAVAEAVAKAVAPALAELVLIVAIVLGALLCLAVAGLLALTGVRVWRWHVNNPQRRSVPAPAPQRVMQARAEARVIDPPRQPWPYGSSFTAGRERQQQDRP